MENISREKYNIYNYANQVPHISVEISTSPIMFPRDSYDSNGFSFVVYIIYQDQCGQKY